MHIFQLYLCVAGLNAIHSLGLVFCDLRPAKLLLDGSGVIKFSDFSLARIEGENLEELLVMFGEQNSNEDSEYDSTEQSSSSKHKTFNKVCLCHCAEYTRLPLCCKLYFHNL